MKDTITDMRAIFELLEPPTDIQAKPKFFRVCYYNAITILTLAFLTPLTLKGLHFYFTAISSPDLRDCLKEIITTAGGIVDESSAFKY